jgi:Ca-activated chloride channel family protein
MNGLATVARCLILLFAFAPSALTGQDARITVDVTEILVHATVSDHRGAPVAGLNKENFSIMEDGVPQDIKHFGHRDIPVTAGLVIDNSGSMKSKRAEVIAAMLSFAGSSNPEDQMFLINFNEHVRFGLPSQTAFTDNSEQLRAVMNTVRADGETALFDAIATALDHLKKGSRDKRVLVVVSDGADNASHLKKAQVLELAKHSDAIIYTIAIYDPDDSENMDPRFMRDLAKNSGGRAYFPAKVEDVRPACENIANEIRNQYSLSYIPSNRKRDGTYRTIKIRAVSPHGENLSVMTRAGYMAAK